MKRLLVVEDNPDLCVVLAEYLVQSFGSEVVAVEDYTQVRAAARSGPFNLVLLDFIMDQVSVGDVVAEIKSSPGNQDTPVVLMSAFDMAELARSRHPSGRRVMRELQAIGAEAWLVKPFSLDTLRETVERIVPTLAADAAVPRWSPGVHGAHGGDEIADRWSVSHASC